MSPSEVPLVQVRGVAKSFAAVRALKGVDFAVDAGRVRGLVGENGAGKSTLIKILSGLYPPDAGSIEIEGRPVRLAGTDDALAARIVTIHQDINLVQTMTVAENVFLNNEPAGAFGVIRRRRMHEAVDRLLREYEVPVDARAVVGDLPNDLKKMVQIIKALNLDPRVLLMDEPTSSLTDVEVRVVLRLIRTLAGRGVGVVLISHYLNEIFAVCDDLTVMRDGEVVADGPVAATSLGEVVGRMIGRGLEGQARRRAPPPAGPPLMAVQGLGIPGRLRDVSFTLGRGEVLGLTGLAGSGLTDLAKALFGAGPGRPSGQVTLDGKTVAIADPARAMRAGLALLTNDRLREGILPDFTLTDNICLPILGRFGRAGGRLDRARMAATAARNIARLRVRTPGPEARVRQLSGGNQQKVLFAKWLETRPKVFIMDEPTIGIDVGSKAEIRGIVAEVAASGVGIVLLTTELDELVTLCDRVLVMFRGAVVAEFAGEGIDRAAILHASVSGEMRAA